MARERDLGTRNDGRYRVVDEDRIVANLVRNLWPYEAAEDRSGADAQARRVLERWIGEGLPLHGERGQRRFDPCEVSNFALQAWLEDGDPVWLSHQVASSRRMVRAMRERAQGAPQIALTFRREFNLRGIAAGTMVRLRVPLPLDKDRVASVRISPDVTALDPALAQSPGRLEIRFRAAEHALASVAVDVAMRIPGSPSGHPIDETMVSEPYDVTSPEYRLHTRAHEGLIRVTGAVSHLADALAGPSDAPARVVQNIWNYFAARMKISFIHYDELAPDDPLGTLIARGWCDCHTGSALFAALARARGIPARIVTGAVLYPIAPSQHSWLEVLLPPHGWLPVDIFGAFLAARSEHETEWSRCFLGQLDPRLVTQRLPQYFLGAPGVRVPPSWYLVQALSDGGATQTLGALDERAWILRDEIRVSAGDTAVALADRAT